MYSFQEKKEELMAKMSKTYLEWVLPILTSDDPMVSFGIREGANKFLSNAYISFFKISKQNPYKGCSKKWLISDYISVEAWKKMDRHDYKGLQFEHIVPKKIYHEYFINSFKNNKQELTVDCICNVLKDCWILATVTKDEHDKLESVEKKEWSLDYYRKNNQVRYNEAGIVIKENKLLADGIVTIKL